MAHCGRGTPGQCAWCKEGLGLLVPTRARPQAHRGADVALGLPELLPQSLCQRSDGILGSTIEMGHGLG